MWYAGMSDKRSVGHSIPASSSRSHVVEEELEDHDPWQALAAVTDENENVGENENVAHVLYDVTHRLPATIEYE